VILLGLNLLLAVIWAFATGAVTPVSLTVGFLVGMAVLHVMGRALGDRRYVVRLVRGGALLAIFVWELLVSSVRVATDVVRPRLTMEPAVIEVPLDLTRDAEITLFANLISLTPGTLTIDVANDRSCLYVHAMYGTDPEGLAEDLKRTFERRIREALR
jgi:multicomponent Na+:H+ antiporter subunit E